jgi:DNA-binding transcriptional MerR regulator
MYSIKAVSQATGLGVETLRAWERRYGVVVPLRDESGRRSYSAEDVLRLRRLREATDRGHPIGRLARLTDEALAGLLEAETGRGEEATARALLQRMLDAAGRYDVVGCEQSLTLAIACLAPPQLISGVLGPLLREVGERWHRGEFAISQERLVSSVVRRHVGLVLETYDRAATGPVIVFATLPGERHELGLLMSAMICASRGCRAHYLGPELPARDVALFARNVGATVVALSVLLVDGVADVPGQLRELAGSLDGAAALWIGGSGAMTLGEGALPAGCTLVRDANELERRLDMLAA